MDSGLSRISGGIVMENISENNSWVLCNGYWRVVKGNDEFTIEYRMGFQVISAWTIDFRLIKHRNVATYSQRELFERADNFIEEFIAEREGGNE